MASKYLGRDDAPFGAQIWEALDGIVVGAARSQLSARRLLEIEGPFGLALKSIPLPDTTARLGDASLMASPALPVPLIETTFALSARDLAAFEETGFSLDSQTVAEAAIRAAQAEDTLLLEGNKELGLEGLLTAKGAQSVTLGKWDETGSAANDVVKALTALDAAGFHGPYTLALAPGLYNHLLRILPQGFQTELQHIESIVGGKVVKAPGIKKGGVLLASGKQFASIVIGQDMATGFIGPGGSGFEFKISESLAPWIKAPSAVCVLKG